LLDAILMMIGYYVIILTAAMVLIVVVVQIFKKLSTKEQHDTPADSFPIPEQSAAETGEELAAAVAAVTLMVATEKPLGVTAWSRVERSVYSPWKVASKSRRMSCRGA
jgi:hypothetical protein